MKWLVLSVFCFVFYKAFADEELCTTPKQESGECVILKNCPELLDLLKRQPILTHKSESAIYLNKAVCGFQGSDPKFCCSSSSVNNVAVRQDRLLEPSNAKLRTASVETDLLPNTDECGIDNTYRLIGGTATELGEFPWVALLEYQTRTGQELWCGGVLISKRYVLTAAHCVVGKTKNKLRNLVSVRLGEYDIRKNPDCDQETCADLSISVPVTDRITHEHYDPLDTSQHHDIALLRLARDVAFTEYIKPICVPKKSELLNKNYTGLNMTVSGWGKTETAPGSNIKLKLELQVKSHSDCVAKYRQVGINFSAGQICAGGIINQDSCQGDSGGPLMRFEGVNWYVTGLVSFGPSPCGLEGWPGIYARVTEYVPWIVSNLKA